MEGGSDGFLETSFWSESDSEDEGLGSEDSTDSGTGWQGGREEEARAREARERPAREARERPGREAKIRVESDAKVRPGLGVLLASLGSRLSQGRTVRGEEVFGGELCRQLEREGREVPGLVAWCTGLIEGRGEAAWEGIYRLSGQVMSLHNLQGCVGPCNS